MIFATASNRSLAHLVDSSTEARLLGQQHERVALLRLVAATASLDDVILDDLPPPFENLMVRLQDVGGLIDLNAATPELIGALFAATRLPPEAQARYWDWRRGPRRLLRTSDLPSVTGAPRDLAPWLDEVATVFSGGSGVAEAVAPEQVRAMLREGALSTDLPASLSPSSNWAVYVRRSGVEVEQYWGTVFIDPQTDDGKALDIK